MLFLSQPDCERLMLVILLLLFALARLLPNGLRYHPRSVAERDSVPFAVSHRRAAGLRGTNGGDTRWWASVDNAHYTENAQAQKQLLLVGRIPPVGCKLCWAVPRIGWRLIY
jgi:hypothetical protein